MDRWTMEVISDTGTAKKIALYFRGRKVDVMSLVRVLNEKERQIDWLESQVDLCQKLSAEYVKVLPSFCERTATKRRCCKRSFSS